MVNVADGKEGLDEKRPEHHREAEIQVTVLYVGHKPYHGDFASTETIGQVKFKALSHFGIEPEAADKYAIQHDGADVPDNETLARLAHLHPELTLVLKEEVPKG
jgi:hypothetical protein